MNIYLRLAVVFGIVMAVVTGLEGDVASVNLYLGLDIIILLAAIERRLR